MEEISLWISIVVLVCWWVWQERRSGYGSPSHFVVPRGGQVAQALQNQAAKADHLKHGILACIMKLKKHGLSVITYTACVTCQLMDTQLLCLFLYHEQMTYAHGKSLSRSQAYQVYVYVFNQSILWCLKS